MKTEGDIKGTVERRVDLIGIILLAAGLLAFSYSFYKFVTESEARATILVVTNNFGDQAGGGLQSSLSLSQNANTMQVMAGLAKSEQVLGSLSAKFNMPIKRMRKIVQVLPDQDSNQLLFTAKLKDGEKAKQICDSYLKSTLSLAELVGLDRDAYRLKALETLKANLHSSSSNRLKILLGENADDAPIVSGRDNPFKEIQTVSAELRQSKEKLEDAKRTLDTLRKQFFTIADKGLNQPTSSTLMEELRRSLLAKRGALETARAASGPSNPEVIRLEDEYRIAEANAQDQVAAFRRSIDQNKLPELVPLANEIKVLEPKIVRLQDMVSHFLRTSAQSFPDYNDLILNLERESAINSRYALATIQSSAEPKKWSILDPTYLVEKDLVDMLLFLAVGVVGFTALFYAFRYLIRDQLIRLFTRSNLESAV